MALGKAAAPRLDPEEVADHLRGLAGLVESASSSRDFAEPIDARAGYFIAWAVRELAAELGKEQAK